MSRIVMLCLLCFSAILVPSMLAASQGPGMIAIVDASTQADAEDIILTAHANGAISMVRLSGQPADGEARLCLRFWDGADRADVRDALHAAGVSTATDDDCGSGAIQNPDQWAMLRLPSRSRRG